MVYPLTYTLPSPTSVDGSSNASVNGAVEHDFTNRSSVSVSSGISNGIPEALSFDRIIAGGVCPPCTTRDFMNYMKYIEYDAEILQFFLWYRDYCRRFESLPASESALSPEWKAGQVEVDSQAMQTLRTKNVDPFIAFVLRDTEFGNGIAQPVEVEKRDPFHDPPRTPSTEGRRETGPSSDYGSSSGDEKTVASTLVQSKKANEAFDGAGMKWKPFTAQPFRQEVTRIVGLYIAVDAPRQLNLSDRERTTIMHALQNTTHPSAFRVAAENVELSLRRQAHPNFIRWTVFNGNHPRVLFARTLGIVTVLAALVADILITLSHAGRAWRVLPIIGYVLGISTCIAAWKGMCIVLHGMHHRHLRPWEMFAEDDDPVHEDGLLRESQNATNSYEDEPWVPKYEKRSMIRKVFDREVWIQEPALRRIQDIIFIQSVFIAFVVGCIIVGIFCAVPHGNLL